MILTALVFLIILTLLVFAHELGHFSVARLFGVAVEEFGFGLPPRIWGKKVGGTVYSVNALPIGGFVKLAGEDDEDGHVAKGTAKKEYFWARSKKERAAILIAGVVMNFIVAVGITSYLLTQGVHEPAGRVHVEKVVAGSPAAGAGIQKGDIVKSIRYQVLSIKEGKEIKIPKDLIDTTNAHKGEEVILTILRDGNELTVSVTPRKDPPKGEGAMGVAISDLEVKVYSWTEAPVAATKINLSRGWEMLTSIAGVTGEAVKFGWKAVLEFASILSLNLAVLNILPIPALDGGRLAFVFLEKILGRKVKPAFEKSTHQIGMIVLFLLVILVSVNDILRLVRGG